MLSNVQPFRVINYNTHTKTTIAKMSQSYISDVPSTHNNHHPNSDLNRQSPIFHSATNISYASITPVRIETLHTVEKPIVLPIKSLLKSSLSAKSMQQQRLSMLPPIPSSHSNSSYVERKSITTRKTQQSRQSVNSTAGRQAHNKSGSRYHRMYQSSTSHSSTGDLGQHSEPPSTLVDSPPPLEPSVLRSNGFQYSVAGTPEALTDTQRAKLIERMHGQRLADREYLRQHPEVGALVQMMFRQMERERPSNCVTCMEEYFRRPVDELWLDVKRQMDAMQSDVENVGDTAGCSDCEAVPEAAADATDGDSTVSSW